MNGLTAYRSFAKPGYTPVKKFRIYKKRWYFCTFQNVERDGLTDYIGLGIGEYRELLPGNKAKEARDAHLNHLNAIEEYQGPVYSVSNLQRGSISYHRNLVEAHQKHNEIRTYNRECYHKAVESIEKQLAQTDEEILAFYGKCSNWAGVEKHRDDLRAMLISNKAYWEALPVITQIERE
jgi:hypothetical protein